MAKRVMRSRVWALMFMVMFLITCWASYNYDFMHEEYKKVVAEKDVWKDIAHKSKDIVVGDIVFDFHDYELLARLIESEAKGEDYKTKLMVGSVVMNRVASVEFPDTVSGVVYEKGQFEVVDNGMIHNTPSDDSLRAAEEIMRNGSVLPARVLVFFSSGYGDPWLSTRPVYADTGKMTFSFLN